MKTAMLAKWMQLPRILEALQAQARKPRRMRMVETIALGEKRFAAILQVDGQQFLVGGGAGNVSLLAELSGAAAPAVAPAQEASITAPRELSFAGEPHTPSTKEPVAEETARSTQGVLTPFSDTQAPEAQSAPGFSEVLQARVSAADSARKQVIA